MTFGEAIRDGFSKYATFDGRSSRSAYWWWFLFALLVGIGAEVLDAILGTAMVLTALTGLALFIPGLAVLVRRFHDAGHSGWWVLILLVPLVGVVVWLIFALTDSKPPNEWGDGPDMPAPSSPGGLAAPSSGGQAPPPQASPPPAESEPPPTGGGPQVG